MGGNRSVERYSDFTPLVLPDRTWPDGRIKSAPRWLSTDLRDGNQSLANPMSPARKLRMFELLVEIGYKEIEIGFPVASQDDHDFVRLLIEEDRIPDDVWVSALVPARDELIERTVRCLSGAPRATLHLYNATAPLFRRVVFGMDRQQCKDLAVRGTELVKKYADKELREGNFRLQYSPELFNETEADFSLEVCEAVMDVWEPGSDRPIILNFPTTVERSLPSVFADQIEWLDRNLSRREHVCLSIHPHNDRGTGVASAELALLAGAERIEGCLFGNGERAGNVCLVTLGMNMFSHGVDPGIDFSDIDRIRDTVEWCNEIPVHPRHPYGGDLVYTSFSGSHQDAIRKGFDSLEGEAAEAGASIDDQPWRMPYLPIDPKDVGRTYEAVVRITTQSGKGGVAYIMNAWYGMRLPKELQRDFATVVQASAEELGCELAPEQIWTLFEKEYLSSEGPAGELYVAGGRITTTLYLDGAGEHDARTIGARLAPWGIDVRAVHREATADPDRQAGAGVTAYAECRVEGKTVWGAGVDTSAVGAALSAVGVALRRSGRQAVVAAMPPA
ncbi:2-isopropylmalate synthase [Nonomuraea rhizosphaerae]|uniref:2-isopropylmalate synthase n=1 Tax=Nonomuraea rhizosphaerae TaxID=2665663 RepID=UPI001C5DA0E6|nr:2-isopropylmalate synthase [Nonomuraea rhizosphaerae]